MLRPDSHCCANAVLAMLAVLVLAACPSTGPTAVELGFSHDGAAAPRQNALRRQGVLRPQRLQPQRRRQEQKPKRLQRQHGWRQRRQRRQRRQQKPSGLQQRKDV